MIAVKVTPRAKFNRVVERDGGLIVHVTAPAVDGQANEAVVALVAKHFGIAKSQVVIRRGLVSRHKLLEVRSS